MTRTERTYYVGSGLYTLAQFARGFADCLVAEFIDAVGTTLASGALEAWAVDGVRAEGDLRPTDALFARGQVVARALMIVGGVACGYLAELGWKVPWLVCTALFAVTAALAAATMRETRARAVPRSLGRTALDGLGVVRAAPVLILLCVLTGIGAFASFPLHILWQPRLEALAGKGLWRMGWIVGLLNLTALVGNAILPRLLRRFARETVLAAAALWRGGTVAVAAAAVTAAPMVAGLVFQEIAFGLSDPVLLAWTNEHVAAAERATVLSVRSTFFTLGGASGLMILGLVARDLGIPTAWAVGAVLFALAAPLYLALGRLAPRVPPREAGVAATVVVPAKVAPPAVEPAYVAQRGASS
ncbi:MAG: MFS transporter [Deltaproteobacteria bacterium]|nr:MAG: MFS transporter [Deltaproteobacteria bacterium]